MSPLLVHAEPTSNPNALKFRLSRVVPSPHQNSLTQAILALGIVDNIEISGDSITVFKKPNSDWGDLLPNVEKTILENILVEAK